MKRLVIALMVISLSFNWGMTQTWSQTKQLKLNTSRSGGLYTAADAVNVPLMILLDANNFDFSQAATDGKDIRFETGTGTPLKYVIHKWDATAKTAGVWVRMDNVKGNDTTQSITMKWGNASAMDAGDWAGVFAGEYLGYWTFDGNTSDETSNAINGTNSGTTDVTGKIGSARSFNGTDNLIDFGSPASMEFGTATDFSVEMWIKTTQTNNDPCILANKDWASGTNVGYCIHLEGGTFRVNIGDGTNRVDVDGSALINDDQWHHTLISADRDGDLSLFVDGKLNGRASLASVGNINSSMPHVLGDDGTKVYAYKFNGQIDNMSITNVARSAEWVKLYYESQISGNKIFAPVVVNSDTADYRPGIKHVIVIGVDGLGSENILQQAQPVVTSLDALRNSGAWTYSNMIDPLNFSGPNWAGMVTGAQSGVHGVTTNNCEKPDIPTIYQLLRDANPSAVIAAIFEWDKVGCYPEDGVLDFSLNTSGHVQTGTEVINYFTSQKPDLLFVHFDEVDGAGHGNGGASTQYKAMVENVDTQIGRIMNALDTSGLRDETLLIITADHGHHPTSGGHAGSDKPVPMIINGPGIIQGEITGATSNNQVALIIAYALGLTPAVEWTSTIANIDVHFEAIVEGCTDSTAMNFDPNANKDNGSCTYVNLFDKKSLAQQGVIFDSFNKQIYLESNLSGASLQIWNALGESLNQLVVQEKNIWSIKNITKGTYMILITKGNWSTFSKIRVD